jgi:16S rRNA (cytosine1402-N4)-methyltransferase
VAWEVEKATHKTSLEPFLNTHLPKLHLTHKSLNFHSIPVCIRHGYFQNGIDEKQLIHKNKHTCENKHSQATSLVILNPSFIYPQGYGTMRGMSIKAHPPQHALHVPVLLDKTIELLQPQPGESYLDLTAGYGGHASAIIGKTANPTGVVLVDRDENAIAELQPFKAQGAVLLQTDFVTAARQLADSGTQFDVVLVDLGVSSPQLDRAERGFSFSKDGPLDMRMDPTASKTASEIVNRSSKEALLRILTEYGEERTGFAHRIVDMIIRQRPFTTTKELADAILGEHRGKWQRIHPATRTFQALRIATNDELGQVEAMLPLLPQLLKHGGRVGIISFHSLEDRLVKRYFKEQSQAGLEAELAVPIKKPLDGATYDVHNPRSRSAKLRVAVKK